MPCTFYFPILAYEFWNYDDRSSQLVKFGILVIWEMQGMTAMDVYNHTMKQWKKAGDKTLYEAMETPDKFYKVRPARLHFICECGSYWKNDVRNDEPLYYGTMMTAHHSKDVHKWLACRTLNMRCY